MPIDPPPSSSADPVPDPGLDPESHVSGPGTTTNHDSDDTKGQASAAPPPDDLTADASDTRRGARLVVMLPLGERGQQGTGDRGDGARRPAGSSFWQRAISSGLVLGMLLLVGVIALQAAGGFTIIGADGRQVISIGASGSVEWGGPAAGRGPDAPTATATPLPRAATPALPSPAPTPLPPIVVAFTCASASHTPLNDPGVYAGHICVTTTPAQPNGTIPISARYCTGQADDVVVVFLGATGTQDTWWYFRPTCAPPITVTLTVSGTGAGGALYTGSVSVVATQ